MNIILLLFQKNNVKRNSGMVYPSLVSIPGITAELYLCSPCWTLPIYKSINYSRGGKATVIKAAINYIDGLIAL